MQAFRDEAAAVHFWQTGLPIQFHFVRDHIAQCPQCQGCNAAHVWQALTGWQQDIDGMRVLGRK